MSQMSSSVYDAITTQPVERQRATYKFASTSPPTYTVPAWATFASDVASLARGFVSNDLAERAGTAIPLSLANGPTGKLVQWVAGKSYEADPNFRLTEEKLKPLTENVPRELWHRYADAVSDDHLYAIYSRNTQELENRKQLQDAGWIAPVANVLAEALDPINLGVAALTGGVGTTGSVATSAARVANLARAGMVAGLPFAGAKAAQAVYDDSVTGSDILEAGLSGFGFGVGAAATEASGAIVHGLTTGIGSGLPILGIDALRSDRDSRDALIGFSTAFLTGAIGSGLSRYARDRLAPVALEQNNAALLADVGDPASLTPKGRQHFAAELDPKAAVAKVDAHAEAVFSDSPAAQLTLAQQLNAAAENITTEQRGALGAASATEFKWLGNRLPAEGKVAGDFEASWVDDSRPSMAKAGPVSTRWGINASLSNSESQVARRFGNMVAFDNLPKKNGRIYDAGDMWAVGGSEEATATLFRGIEQDYQAYAKAGGTLDRSAYSEAIGKLVRRNLQDPDAPEQLIASAKRVQQVYKDVLNLEKRHGVTGADGVTENLSHFTRRWLEDKIFAADEKHGTKYVLTVLGEAISKHPDNAWMEPSQVVTAATAIYKNGGKPGNHASHVGFLEGTIDEIRGDLLGSGVSEAEASALLDKMKFAYRKTNEPGTPINLRYRIPLDELHSIQTPAGVLSIEDLLDSNVHRVVKSRIRRGYGNAAAAEVFRLMSPDPQNPLTSFQQIATRVREEAAAKNLDRVKIEADIAKMETAYRNMVGLPLSDDVANSRLWKAAGILRSGLSASMLGNWYAGLTNATEWVTALARPDSIARVFPALPELWSIAKDGKPSNACLREFEFLTGRGVDWVTHNADTYIPVAGESIDIALAKADRAAQVARRFSAKISGMAQGNELGYKVLGFDILQKWGDWADSGKMPPKWAIREMGFENNEGLLRSVLDQINKHKTAIKGEQSGVRMWDLGTKNWTDLEAFSAFRAAVYAETTTRFVNPLPNQLPRWMSTEMGKMFGQFRTFSAASWDSKLLQAIHSRNPDHVRMFMVNAGLASALYSLKVYTESLGRPDAQEYRDKMLAPEAIARVAFSRSAYASLAPVVLDATTTTLGGPALFSGARASGIQGGGLMSVPIADWFGGTTSGVGTALRNLYDSERQFSMKDLRNLRRSILFLPNVEPLVKGIDALGRAYGLPEESGSTGGSLIQPR